MRITVIFATIIFFGLSACKKNLPDLPEPVDPKGTANYSLKLNLLANGEEVDISSRKSYVLYRDYSFQPIQFELYLSNIGLETEDGDTIEIADVHFFNFSAWQGGQIDAEMPVGKYSKVFFHYGLDKKLNATDPSTVAVDHPLGTNNQMFWSWSSKYLFTRLNGKSDTLTTNDPRYANNEYHVGRDDFSELIVLDAEFFVRQDGGFTTEIDIDLRDLFSKPFRIDYTEETATGHIGGSTSTAQKFNQNMINALQN